MLGKDIHMFHSNLHHDLALDDCYNVTAFGGRRSHTATIPAPIVPAYVVVLCFLCCPGNQMREQQLSMHRS